MIFAQGLLYIIIGMFIGIGITLSALVTGHIKLTEGGKLTYAKKGTQKNIWPEKNAKASPKKPEKRKKN